jgi:tRNA (uracil-5-)-methyltransferase TRM9
MLAVRRLLECVSPQHGRVLIYVWALEQDELSKRMIPHDLTEDGGRAQSLGEDVFVPWVMSNQTAAIREEVAADSPQVYNRYYHMFAKGELRQLVLDAAQDFGLLVGPKCDIATVGNGLEIMQDGWERSNYFVELRLWQR